MTVAVKWTLQGAFIYATMALYAIALVLLLAEVIVRLTAKGRRGTVLYWTGIAAYAAGATVATAGVIYRGLDVGHLPMQNLFEVFLCLGALMFPLSMLSRYVLRVAGEWTDALVGVIVLVPAGFVFSAAPQQLPPALQSGLFGPHVAAYIAAYVVLGKAAVQAGTLLVRLVVIGDEAPPDAGLVPRDRAVDRMVRMGFPLLTLGLVLGAVWGKQVWGDWWNWDPKEMWSLTTWLAFVAYFHLRATLRRWPRVNAGVGAIVVLIGFALVIVTLLWANLSRIFEGMHSYA